MPGSRRIKWSALLGVPVGVVAFYCLSLASAFWWSSPTNMVISEYAVALTLSIAVYVAMVPLAVRRPDLSLLASGTMLLIALGGAIAAPTIPMWVFPLPADFPQLWFHGSSSPLLLCFAFCIGIASALLWRGRSAHVD